MSLSYRVPTRLDFPSFLAFQMKDDGKPFQEDVPWPQTYVACFNIKPHACMHRIHCLG